MSICDCGEDIALGEYLADYHSNSYKIVVNNVSSSENITIIGIKILIMDSEYEFRRQLCFNIDFSNNKKRCIHVLLELSIVLYERYNCYNTN
jgi:hypothetical protein